MKGMSLTSLPQKKITTGLKRLQEAGITPAQWLQMLNADPPAMKDLVHAWPQSPAANSQNTGIVYDAQAVSRLLGLPVNCCDPVPTAREGEVVIYYGGWSLRELRQSPAGLQWMFQGSNLLWGRPWQVESGYYRLLFPVPFSEDRPWDEQREYLSYLNPMWQVCPVLIGATAQLARLMYTGVDFLEAEYCRCAEQIDSGSHSGLWLQEDRLTLTCESDTNRHDTLWLFDDQ